MSKYKLCIFDMDGTVIRSIPSIAHYANDTLNRYGYPSLSEECYVRFIGNGARTLVRRMLREVGGNEEALEQILTDYVAAYDADPVYLSRPFDGIMEMLHGLKAAGIKVAILSNKPDSTVQILSRAFFGDDLMDFSLGAKMDEDLKPNPKMVHHIMEKFQISPEETAFVGDSPTDILTAHNAGVLAVGVTWGYSTPEAMRGAGAHHLTDDPKEILSLMTEA